MKNLMKYSVPLSCLLIVVGISTWTVVVTIKDHQLQKRELRTAIEQSFQTEIQSAKDRGDMSKVQRLTAEYLAYQKK